MTEQIAPPWGTDWKPASPPVPVEADGGKAWQFQPGQSGNPRGRPPGRPDRRLLATQQMLDEMRNIIAVLVGKALEGDTNAASIVLAKILPSVKAQAEKVSFEFDAAAPISEQVAQVLDAVAAGAVAPDVGRLIIDSIKSLSDVRATEELAARIEALEEASDARR
ncbi:DUF5681 domain-containing protein [Sphingobium sufflavum]|uniref:DUF5681 domain-containing protein n=1 Tax=Sphingobium sufflavum TaxID=1129547 RepID=UPI001F354388|nr:DUF5681 domain-containing protein [Sphingobium sufflavum]MCE7798435.1 DUF5681 domain-containing protein [Sphingobium sufflavum]